MTYIARLFAVNLWVWLARFTAVAALAVMGPLVLDLIADSRADQPARWTRLGPVGIRSARSLAQLSPMLMGLAFCAATSDWVRQTQDHLVAASGRPFHTAWLPGLALLLLLQAGVEASAPLLEQQRPPQSSFLGPSGDWGAIAHTDGQWHWCWIQQAPGSWDVQQGASTEQGQAPSRLVASLSGQRSPRAAWTLRPLLLFAMALVASRVRRRRDGTPAPLLLLLPVLGQTTYVLATGPIGDLLGPGSPWAEVGALGLTCALLHWFGGRIAAGPRALWA